MSGLSVKVAIKQVDDAEEGLVWVEFDIEVEKNKTLDMFTKVLSKPDGQKIVDTASTIMRIAEETGQDPLDIFAQAKAKLDAQKASGEAQH